MPTMSVQASATPEERQPKPGKRHAKGWTGSSTASRTRRSPARGSKKPGHKKTQRNCPPPGERIAVRVQLFPQVG